MSNAARIKELEEELRQNHITRIHDNSPGLSYFKLMKREMEILTELKALRPEPPTEEQKKDLLWSEKEVQLLRTVYADQTAAEIATALGRTENAVRSKVKLLQLKKQPETNQTTSTDQ